MSSLAGLERWSERDFSACSCRGYLCKALLACGYFLLQIVINKMSNTGDVGAGVGLMLRVARVVKVGAIYCLRDCRIEAVAGMGRRQSYRTTVFGARWNSSGMSVVREAVWKIVQWGGAGMYFQPLRQRRLVRPLYFFGSRSSLSHII
jgi:hypothetical protein